MYIGLAKFVKDCGACADPDDIDILKSFLDGGADPDERERDYHLKKTALSWAAENGNKALVRLMIQYGANVHLVDKNGHTPLMIASRKGHKEVVQMLIEAGSDVNKVCDEKFGRTALTDAATWGHDAVVRLLIESGADTEALDKAYGAHMTPLMLTVVYQHESTARLLIEMGAYPSIESPYDNLIYEGVLIKTREMFDRIIEERKKAYMGLLRTMPMMMLWRKRATERLYHPSKIDFARILEEDG